MVKKGKEISIEHLNLERIKEQVTDVPGLIPYPHNSSSALIRPEDQGKVKANALKAMEQQTDREWRQIVEQMRPLIDQANALKKRVHYSQIIYQAKIPFEPQIGHSYFLYEDESGPLLSMIGPNEWGRKKMPYQNFLGEVKLLADHTWDII